MLSKAPIYVEYKNLLNNEQINVLTKLIPNKNSEIVLNSKTIMWISDEITPKLNTVKNYRFDLYHLGQARIIDCIIDSNRGDFCVEHKDPINFRSNVLKSYTVLIVLNDSNNPCPNTNKAGEGIIFSGDFKWDRKMEEGVEGESVVGNHTKKILLLDYMCYVTDMADNLIEDLSIDYKLKQNKFVVLHSISAVSAALQNGDIALQNGDITLQNGDIATFDLEYVSYEDKIYINKFELNGTLVYFNTYEITLFEYDQKSTGYPLIAIDSDYDNNYLRKGPDDEFNDDSEDIFNGIIFEHLERVENMDVFVAKLCETKKECMFNPSKPELTHKVKVGSQIIKSDPTHKGYLNSSLPYFNIDTLSKTKMNAASSVKAPSNITASGLDIMLDVILSKEATSHREIQEPQHWCDKFHHSMSYYVIRSQGVVDLTQYTCGDDFDNSCASIDRM